MSMTCTQNVVSIHPYFMVHPGKMAEFQALLPAIVELAATEEKNLFYDFTVNGDEVFCRESYVGADGLLEHLGRIGALLEPLLKLADLPRLEIHGPAEELEKLKAPLAHLRPVWFTRICGR